MDDVDKNLFWTAIVFFVGLVLLGVHWWQALTVGVFAAICWYLTYGRRIVSTLGLCVLILGFGNWIGLIPELAFWPRLLTTLRYTALGVLN
jgi:hypothetical protein